MALGLGTRLGAYEILTLLGSGGMGEVYRAKDTKLGRDVALKILPATFTNDPERLARFRREAQVLAALNHPHIGAIYGLDDANGQQFLVLELVDGESLDKRIARGPIPVDEALGIAKQIAEALEAAHEKGIIHRDLKPANIALTGDGNVKVLDFGLAKAIEIRSGTSLDVTDSPTITTPAMMTGVGMILGTAAYMSPEQAKGKPADKRSDVWAFGCVLYEMLTGKRPFEGEDVSDTLAAVLRGEPDWTALPSDIPPAMHALIRRCLRKDRGHRIADMSTALFVIDEPSIITPTTSAAPPTIVTPRPWWRRAIPATGASLVVGAIAAIATWNVRPSPPPSSVTRFALTLPEGQQFANFGRDLVALSPDGTQMVYVANQQLYLRSMYETEARPIQGSQDPIGLTSPTFSPDGRSIAFVSSKDRALKRIAVGGGGGVTICPVPNTSLGVSWGADGIVFGQRRSSIMRVSPNGGQPAPLVSVKNDELAYGPHVLPGGEAILFTLVTGTARNSDPAGDMWDEAQIVVQSLRSGERRTLITGGSDARYVPTGHIVYAVSGVLFAVPFDLRRLQVVGGSVPIVEGVRRGVATGSANFSFSHNGTLIYVPGPVSRRERDLAFMDRQGGTEPFKLEGGAYEYPRVSPDGKRLAVETDDGKDANIWISDLTGTSSLRRLTLNGRNQFPVWSPDSERVAFQSDREGDLPIFWQRADGSSRAERLTKPDPGTAHVPWSWSPDGKRLLFGVSKGSNASLWTVSPPDTTVARMSDVQSSYEIEGAFSPDGRWVAYTSATGPLGVSPSFVFVQPFPSTGAKYLITGGSGHPFWSSDGKELFYSGGGPEQFQVVSVITQPSLVIGDRTAVLRIPAIERPPNLPRNYDITPDGKRFIVVVSRQAQSAESAAPQIQVVLNWTEELKQRVPTR